MIRFLLLQNRQGKTRLSKWYVPVRDTERSEIEYEVHRLVTKRSRAASNILEYGQYKIVYKQYAGLFFSCCIDLSDNELVVLESMHLFVELLDHYFEQVCELDLIFNFHKVYLILDQFILAGEVQETSKKTILERLSEIERTE